VVFGLYLQFLFVFHIETTSWKQQKYEHWEA